MSNLIEITFENVSLAKIGSLLKDLCSNKVKNYSLTTEDGNIDGSSDESIEKFFFEYENFSLFINLYKLEKNQIVIPNCSIAVFKDKESVDVILIFEESDLNHEIQDLMYFAKALASQYQIDLYYCGLDPAYDLDTRFFTKENIGPLTL